ncbi:hypothetical protein Tco_1406834 [Tanacetum coccineum]
MSGSTSTPKQVDVTKFLQCSLVDPKEMASEYKFNRHGDFKKLANDALAPNASPNDLKKSKAGLRESITKGRERVKIFSESVLAVNKCFAHIPTKQRSRPNGLSGVSRMGPPNVIDVNQQKAEERGINTAPNKRTRTSKGMMRHKRSCYIKSRFSAPVEIPKQLSTAKLSLDKPKSVRSKPPRPHTRRPSDRNSNSRPKPSSVGLLYTSRSGNQLENPLEVCTRLCLPQNLTLIVLGTYRSPNAVQKLDDDIDGLISDLGNKYHEKVSRKTSVLDKLLKTTTEAKALQEKESKLDSVDEQTVLAYQKYMSCYGPNAPGGRSAGTKLAKKEALANVKQTLERCQEFETTGKSCNSFMDNVEDEPPLHFSHLEIPEMDVLGDAFSEQSQDLGSWLNTIDDIILQDDEFIGLEIPMDDLSDIKMTV